MSCREMNLRRQRRPRRRCDSSHFSPLSSHYSLAVLHFSLSPCSLFSLSQAADDLKAVEPVSAKAKKKQQAKALKALAASGKRGGGSSASGGGGEDDTEEGEATVLTKKANVKHSGKGWEELSLSRPLLRAVKDLGFTHPTPIQAEAIPYALQGRDICGAAVTGSGKTAAFILPVLERLIYRPRRIAATRVLIITPTRELAVQIHAMTTGLGRHTDVRVAMAVGGLSLQTQETALRTRPDIVVATPGRMIDLIRNSNSISMEELEILIMDEADRLLDLGFQDEVSAQPIRQLRVVYTPSSGA